MTTTQHQVTIRFKTDDAEDVQPTVDALEAAILMLATQLDGLGALALTTRYETRRNGFGTFETGPAEDPDEDGDEA